jgi:hypothetical protein
MVEGFIPGRSKRFFFSPTHPNELWDPPSTMFDEYQCFCLAVKQLGPEVCNSPPYSARVKNEWTCTFVPHIDLNNVDRNNFTFYQVTLHNSM